MTAIGVRDLAVHYGELLALDVDELAIDAGRVCGLVGMNGAGKSTLFKALAGIVRPDRGTVRLGGLTPDAARRAGHVAYVPQSEEIDLAFPVSVREVVLMGRYGRLGITRRPRASDRTAVESALERVGLGELAERPIGRLSGGQRKRAFLARAIAQEAPLLLLDEPFAGVDRVSEETIARLLREFAASGGTVLVATHDLAALPALATEAVLLMRRVLLHAATSEVIRPENLARAFGLDPGAPGAAA